MNAQVALIILDGWGVAEDPTVSAIDHANINYFPYLLKHYPHSELLASEEAVGLPAGQMGNSEVGHINIGAGRVVYQELERISRAISSGEFWENPVFQDLLTYCRTQNKPLHIIGLVSDGGVHSSIVHLKGILFLLKAAQLPAVYLHCITDGRDTAPKSAIQYIQALETFIAGWAKIVSVVGRYYAMDRDKRWERTKKAYDLLVHGKGESFSSAVEGIEANYRNGVTDEFIEPFFIDAPICLQPGDGLLNFNFRTDRNRQISIALTQQDLPEYDMFTLPLKYATMNRYDKTYQNIDVLFERATITQTLGEVLEHNGKTQIRIAETEKYPHVTFFFNGGREEPFAGEKRILIPSPKVATYDLAPEMSANGILEAILPEIEQRTADFICLNFANPDMVGHTGVFDAAIKACETVDRCLETLVEACLKQDYYVLIIADHGNVDKMRNADGTPHTAHTLAKVPCLLISNSTKQYRLQNGVLGDVAPTILALMGIAQPEAMTGQSLLLPLGEAISMI